MFYFWLFEVSLLTIASATPIKEDGHIGKCPPLPEVCNKLQYMCHKDPNTCCTCILGYLESHGCGLRECSPVFQKCGIDPHPPVDNIPDQGCRALCPPDQPSLIAHKDCSKYCCCINGLSIVKTCPKNHHFSVEKNTCVDPKDAKRENNSDDRKNCRCVNGYPITRVGPKTDNFRLHFLLNIGINTGLERCNCNNIGTRPESLSRRPINSMTRPAVEPTAMLSTWLLPPNIPTNPVTNLVTVECDVKCCKFCKCDWERPYIIN